MIRTNHKLKILLLGMLGMLFIGLLAIGFFLGKFSNQTSKLPLQLPTQFTVFELEPTLTEDPWSEYCDTEYEFHFSFPTVIKVGNRLLKPYVDEYPYDVKNVVILLDVPDIPDANYTLLEVWVMENPDQLPLRMFVEKTLAPLEGEQTLETSFKGFEALLVDYECVDTVDFFIAKDNLVYKLRSGYISWERPGLYSTGESFRDHISLWLGGFLSLKYTPLWQQIIDSFDPTLCKK